MFMPQPPDEYSVTVETGLPWSPLPGKIPVEINSAFRRYSLTREIQQTSMVLGIFAVFSLLNFIVDWFHATIPLMMLNCFLFLLILVVTYFTNQITGYKALDRVGNVFTTLVIVALLVAKTTTDSGNWFVYFADILVIVTLTVALPISPIVKLICALAILGADGYELSRSPFPIETILGVALTLVAATAFSQAVYFKMQQAHFTAFLSLRREVAVNERLRNANNRIDTLQELLPVCANCKKVRDDNGYWEQIEEYMHSHLDVSVSHGICPDCIIELYPELPGDKR